LHDNHHFENKIYAVAWEQNSKLAKDEYHPLRNGLFPKFGSCLKIAYPNRIRGKFESHVRVKGQLLFPKIPTKGFGKKMVSGIPIPFSSFNIGRL
jgi:hypothetical protein